MAKTAAEGEGQARRRRGRPECRQQRALDRSLVDAKRRVLNKGNGFVQAANSPLDETGSPQLHGAGRRRSFQALAAQLLPDIREQGRPPPCALRGVRRRRGGRQESQMTKHDDPIEQIRVCPHQPLGGKAEPTGRARALLSYNMALSTTRPNDLARALEPQRGCCSRRWSAASWPASCATTSGPAGSPRSCSTPATRRCRRRSCTRGASPPTTSGRSAWEGCARGCRSCATEDRQLGRRYRVGGRRERSSCTLNICFLQETGGRGASVPRQGGAGDRREPGDRVRSRVTGSWPRERAVPPPPPGPFGPATGPTPAIARGDRRCDHRCGW